MIDRWPGGNNRFSFDQDFARSDHAAVFDIEQAGGMQHDGVRRGGGLRQHALRPTREQACSESRDQAGTRNYLAEVAHKLVVSSMDRHNELQHNRGTGK